MADQNIKKLYRNKVAMEDLDLGTGTTTQTRNGQAVVLHKVNAANLPYDETNLLSDIYDDIATKHDTVVAKEALVNPHYTNIDAVGSNISNVNAVASNETNINLVQANKTNINTVAGQIINNNLQDVANSINEVIKVAEDLNEATSEIEVVAADLELGASSKIEAVGTNLLGTDTIGIVASNIDNINIVAGQDTNITNIANDIIPNIAEILLADDNATTATTQAGIATTKAGEASASASNASASESNALASENKAHLWAEEDYNVEVEPGEYSAKHWAIQAQGYAGGVTFEALNGNGDVGTGADQVAQGNHIHNLADLTDDATHRLVTDTILTKIDGIEDGATADQTKEDIEALNINASSLTQDYNNRLVTDTEKATWNGKLDATHDMTLTLSGDVTGTATFTNMGNATLTATIADDSHNHTIANVDGLQTALNGKLSTGGTAANSDKLDNLDSSQFVRRDTSDVIVGNHAFYGTDTNGEYFNAPIEIREVNLVNANQSSYQYAPALSFHWGGIVQSQIKLHSDGQLYCGPSNSSGNLMIHSGNIASYVHTPSLDITWTEDNLWDSQTFNAPAGYVFMSAYRSRSGEYTSANSYITISSDTSVTVYENDNGDMWIRIYWIKIV